MSVRASGLGTILLMGLVAPSLLAQCGATPRRVTDWALHRQWLVERDCTHPAWPARLVEVPWSDGAAQRERRGVTLRGSGRGASRLAVAEDVQSLPVRPGMQVLVTHRDREAEIRLSGTALEGGAAGAVVLVRAGLNRVVLRAMVVGPARVELLGGGLR